MCFAARFSTGTSTEGKMGTGIILVLVVGIAIATIGLMVHRRATDSLRSPSRKNTPIA